VKGGKLFENYMLNDRAWRGFC